jgi:hypothetical protein
MKAFVKPSIEVSATALIQSFKAAFPTVKAVAPPRDGRANLYA